MTSLEEESSATTEYPEMKVSYEMKSGYDSEEDSKRIGRFLSEDLMPTPLPRDETKALMQDP